MADVFSAFRQWLAAEEDVRDANALLMFYIRTQDLASQPGQSRVMDILQADAANSSREYLAAMQALAR